MNRLLPRFAGILFAWATLSATATVYLVDVNNPFPSWPYADWTTAATNIQDAVDAATAGDQILVTNGVYGAGGRVVYGAMTNRVAVTKAVTVQSVNGPAVTAIQGYQAPDTNNGDSAIRCVYLTNGAALVGFTLTNGATRAAGDRNQEESGGGVFGASSSSVVSNCVLAGNSAFWYGGGVYTATLNNCTLTGNSASYGGGEAYTTLTNCTLAGNAASQSGGGAYYGTLSTCILTNNSAFNGGGAFYAKLNTCTLAGNSASYNGGGTYYGTLYSSVLTGNSASSGGGSFGSTLTNCTLAGNLASTNGGGAEVGTLTNCTLTGNSAGNSGGGAYNGSLFNCTLAGNSAAFGGGGCNGSMANCALAGNSASQQGGGVCGVSLANCTLTGNSAGYGGGAYSSTLKNCVIYFNWASLDATTPNYSGGSLNYCCAAPLPGSGIGNLAGDPQLAGLWHLSAGSPCRAAGKINYTTGVDIDGERWANPPSIGCDESYSGSITGALVVCIQAPYTNVALGFTLGFEAVITGRPTASAWDFGDGTVVSNRPYASHTWTVAGDYPVILRAYNNTYPGGVSATTLVQVVTQPVYYVALTSASPVPPYTNWPTAATSIQDAVDAAAGTVGAVVLVSNGVYGVGGRVVYGTLSNRVADTTPMAIQSVNGPGATTIQGWQAPGTTNGDSAVRCVYLANGASLVGFTLTNGATRASGDPYQEQTGGAVFCGSYTTLLSNCVIAGNCAAYWGGGAYSGTLTNCILAGNSAGSDGGGVYSGVLNNCALTNNSAGSGGGGAYSGTLNSCTLAGNRAGVGGGANSCTLTNCLLAGNAASQSGGGASGGTLLNCTLTGNSAYGNGGGADSGVLGNCALTGNCSSQHGGGANGCTLTNCTLTGNSAYYDGGGAASCALKNCLIYYNNASLSPVSPNYSLYSGGGLTNCCTTPLPSSGSGNLAADPQLASPSHLSTNSPCRHAGSASYTIGVDIDGESWASPPSIGCDEVHVGAVTGAMNVAIQAPYTSVVPGLALDFVANITGRVSASKWDFGDGTIVSNQPYSSHAWGAAGSYAVVLWAYNETYPGGMSATALVQVVTQPVHHVALTSLSPASPYTNWTTAATTIQDAIDAVTTAGALVLVSNGVYGVGGRVVYGALSNRVAVTKPITVQSVNGAGTTVIQGNPGLGDNAVRCVYLNNGTVLAGFTLTNGATRAVGDGNREQCGGGVWCEPVGVAVSNCVISGNSANLYGGGACSGTLNNCALVGNQARLDGGGGGYAVTLNNCALAGNYGYYGGAVFAGTLSNCTVTGNSASGGGAAYNSTLVNCTVTGNSAAGTGGPAYSVLYNCIIHYNLSLSTTDNYYDCTLNYCCTTPSPGSGLGNFTDEPRFVDQAGGNLRLKPTSPCINAGSNAYVSGGTDLEGNPRIVGGTVDVGAYEFQSANAALFSAWLQQFGLPTDGSADYADTDGDGMNNWQEWIAGTNPTNAASALWMLPPTNTLSGVTLSWISVTNRSYFVLRATDLAESLAFSLLQSNVAGLPDTTSFTDTNAPATGPAFYRVGVHQ